MQTRIFDPLGMTTCGFGAMGTAGKIDQPWQHKLIAGKHLPIDPGPLADNPAVIAPAGSVHCSILDWAKFIQIHLQGEQRQSGPLKLKPETIKYLHTAPIGGNYGFGWLILDRPWAGGRVLNHTGSNTQNYAVVWVAPAKDFAVLVMTNQADTGEETFRACDETASALIQKFLAMK